jgi:hypothetical protein
MSTDLSAALQFYVEAWRFAHESGFSAELEWQKSLDFAGFSESDLLRETAWVVLCSGFREKIVREVFDYISLCFCDWESSEAILQTSEACRLAAFSAFQNKKKIDALIKIAGLVHQVGFEYWKQRILQDPITALQAFPFIGGVTAFHLAKNLGLEVAKPDRHLVNLAGRFGYSTTEDLCRDLAKITGEKVSVVDLALWRFMAEHSKHENRTLSGRPCSREG